MLARARGDIFSTLDNLAEHFKLMKKRAAWPRGRSTRKSICECITCEFQACRCSLPVAFIPTSKGLLQTSARRLFAGDIQHSVDIVDFRAAEAHRNPGRDQTNKKRWRVRLQVGHIVW